MLVQGLATTFGQGMDHCVEPTLGLHQRRHFGIVGDQRVGRSCMEPQVFHDGNGSSTFDSIVRNADR